LALARGELQRQDLLVFDGKLYQLLSLPPASQPLSVPDRGEPAAPPPKRGSGPPKQLGELLAALGWRS
jgi:hypothetical protein